MLQIDATTRHFVTLAEVKAHLDKTAAGDDAEVYRMRNAAEEQVQRIVGPILWRDYVTVSPVKGGSVLLPHRPVVAVAAVGAGSAAGAPLTGWVLHSATGIVSGLTWHRSAAVTYTAGRTEVDSSTILATAIIAKHLWATQQSQGPQMGFGPDGDLVETPAGFAIPRRASDLLSGQGPVFA